MDNGRYNGYANHATWKVNLEYFSDYVQNLDDEEVKKLAATKTSEELRGMFMDRVDEWSNAADENAELQTDEWSEAMKAHTALRESLQEDIETYIKEGTDDEIIAGLAFSFLNEVNWVEIADKIITDARDRLKG